MSTRPVPPTTTSLTEWVAVVVQDVLNTTTLDW